MIVRSATRKKDAVNALTERVKKRRRELQEATPYISSQVSHSFTTSWQETEGQPADLRRAKAYARVMQDNPIVIRDGELIVGSLTKYLKGSTPFTSSDPARILRNLGEQSLQRLTSYTKAAKTDEEEKRLLKEDALYWEKTLPPRDYSTEELRREFGDELFDAVSDPRLGMMMGVDSARGTKRLWLDTEAGSVLNLRVLRDGLNSVISRANAEQEKMSRSDCQLPYASAEFYHKYILRKSVIMACEAVIEFAKRHAELAKKMAGKEVDPLRKRELEEIAEHCEWVPANTPRSFAEALQSLQFILIGLRRDGYEVIPLGRLDQYLYPYYEKDLREGKITRQEAAELLGCMLVKVNEVDALVGAQMEAVEEQNQAAEAQMKGRREKEGKGGRLNLGGGGGMLPHITIGGRTKDGKDATNDLSYLILEVVQQMHWSEPAVYIRYHDGMKKEFLLKALEVNRELGGGIPCFLNDQLGTARFLARGVKIDDAIDWCAEGCLSYYIPSIEFTIGNNYLIGSEVNNPQVLELALYNGVNPGSGKQIGLQTGDVTKFTRIEQFYEAFEKQFSHIMDLHLRAHFIKASLRSMERINPPFTTAMFEDCITTGLGPNEGGLARYPKIEGMMGDRGCTDVADSLAAIKKLVFDEKKYTMAELMEALKANWEGYEEIRQACLKAPKYGNDDDYVDDIFNYVSLKTQEIMLSKRDPVTGRKLNLMKAAFATHIPMGMLVGALPNSRKAGSPLNDAALSAMPGADVNGPTAVINSATKVSHAWEEFGIVLNLKFSRPSLGAPEKLEKLLSLVKTFFDRGGWHIQFNILDADELIDAKKHPEKHANLIVRIAGFSAYFVDISPSIQDEIISRTQHST